MALSGKHYRNIAAEFEFLRRWRQSPEARDVLDTLAHNLAAYFADDNDRFDKDRFLEACGLTPDK